MPAISTRQHGCDDGVAQPYGHATRIDSIDTRTPTTALPGVLAVITAADINDQMAAPLPMVMAANESYPVFHNINRYPLASDKVRHVGDPVAVVVAENKYAAADALEAIEVNYTPLPTVVDPEKAMADGAPQLHDHVPHNIAFRWQGGNDVSAAFAAAEKVIEVRIHNQRLLPTAMEPRAVTAVYDAANDSYTIWTSTQIPHSIKEEVAQVLGIDQEKIRAIAPKWAVAGASRTSLPKRCWRLSWPKSWGARSSGWPRAAKTCRRPATMPTRLMLCVSPQPPRAGASR
ncbi:MAG: molybdopterin cofactor-binding domain-containing protein [Caldilineaceae bacterium]